jgi:hypothetical protein
MENHGQMILTGEKLLTHSPGLFGNPTNSHLVAKQEERGNYKFSLQSILVYTSKKFFTCHKNLQHGDDGFTILQKEGMLQIFIALKNPSS